MKKVCTCLILLCLLGIVLAEKPTTTIKEELPEILMPVGEGYVDSVFERLLDKDLQVKSFFIDGETGLGRTGAKNINFIELDKIINLECVVNISSVVAAGERERLLRQLSSLWRSGKEYSIPRELFDAYARELKKCKFFLHDDDTLEEAFAKEPEGFLRSTQAAQPAVFAHVYRGERLDFIVQVTNAVARDYFGNNISIFVMLHDGNDKIKDFRLLSVKADTEGCASAAQKIWDHLNINGVIVEDEVRASLFLPRDMNDKAMPLDKFMYEYYRLRLVQENEQKDYFDAMAIRLREEIAASKSKIQKFNLEEELTQTAMMRLKELDRIIRRLQEKMQKYQKKPNVNQ